MQEQRLQALPVKQLDSVMHAVHELGNQVAKQTQAKEHQATPRHMPKNL